ncbi:glycosyltransferase [Candidatus Micrarchaeota archaeon]|nr:glycosyltransferase [Candidatus Micrarchaeota archaeon]
MLSFIIPTINEEEHIEKLLGQLSPQLNEKDEIIIVDSYSKDKTVEIAESYGAKVIKQPKKGIGLAKTEGAKKAKNEILAFMDADCIPPKDFVKRIKDHFEDPNIVAVGGLDLYSSDSKLWGFLYNSYSKGVFHSSKLTHSLTGKYWVPANNCAYRKETFFSIGGYRSVVCEDTDMMYRMPASKNVIYDPKLALVLSDRRFKENGFFRTVALWGLSNVLCFTGKGVSTKGYRTD